VIPLAAMSLPSVEVIDHAALDGLVDLDRLNEWITEQDLPGVGPITGAIRLQGGSQNNIYLLQRGDAQMVLRRPPQHLRRNSNDTMLREARVLAALKGSSVPHPEFFASCDDLDVIGVCFYLMAPIDGFTPPDSPSYADDPSWPRRLAEEMADGAAALGSVDHEAVGLADFGRPENWLERQVSRWRSQLEGYAELDGYPGSALPHVDRVGQWLDDHRPAECHIGICHGDYQFANVMFSPAEPKLAAIVDWELCTLGDPKLDVAWMLTAWHQPDDPPGHGEGGPLLDRMPSRRAVIEHYGAVSGRPIDDMPWYFVLACYKLGILLEGTHARALAGQAPIEIGEVLHRYATWLLEMGAQTIASGDAVV
jgi:aminoglycoside phosphotransferase (APT) family kinase protein